MNRRNYGRGTSFRREGPGGGMRSLKAQELDHDRETARTRQADGGMEWKKIDLHLHTPASSDYRDPGISYLDILKKAEEKGLDMIAFADHNTVGGYAAMHREIETLTLLERLGRMSDIERETLNEYRRLLAKLVVLPGFEFTATFGFHILGIFPENTSVRKLEYLLLNLNVPEEKMVMGAPDAGSTSDVLNSYQQITAAGGLAIAAHANSSNGVAMQGFPFGGQTKIAYTQDLNLAALEVTDLEVTGRRTTASFYNGSKPEYPRRMHIIQGSDAHSLNTEQSDSMNKRLGVGARITEVLVRDASFASLKELLTSNDFTRTRPFRQGATWEFVEKARQEGQTLTQSFHERAISRTSRTRPILHDIVAFSNSEGGTVYVGANADSVVPIHGQERPDEAIRMLREDIRRTIEPPVELDISNKGSAERGVVVITVPKGAEVPYAFTPTGQIYIRVGGESVVANRDEIVSLVLEASRSGMAKISSQPQAQTSRAVEPAAMLDASEPASPVPAASKAVRAAQLGTPSAQGTRPLREERREQTPTTKDEGPAAKDALLHSSFVPGPSSRGQSQQSPREHGPESTRALPSSPTPPPPAERRAVRPPVFSNLPPEKLKGQIRPMMPANAAQEVAGDTQLEMPTLITAEAVEAERPLALPATLSEELELVPALAPEKLKSAGRSGRSRGRKSEQTAAAEAQAPAAPEPVSEAAPAAQAEPEKKPGRGRSRRKGEAQAVLETAAEAPAPESWRPGGHPANAVETGMPAESTVSAEHLTREEIVEAHQGTSRPSKTRSRARHDKQTEIGAPTAAAAETEAAAEAILVQAEIEPGPQVPSEITPEAAEPELTAPPATPAKPGRSRRKSKAQQAAEATIEMAPVEAEAPVPSPVEVSAVPEETRRKSRSRGRSRKQDQPESSGDHPAGNTQRVPGEEAVFAAAPEGPNTGVEIITTEERAGQKYHTMRDMRDGTTVHNVTRKSARRLWYYAILQHEHGDPSYAEIAWHPNSSIGLWRREHRAGASRYDLVARYPDGSLRIFYGVTDDGLTGPWQELVQMATEAEYWGPPPVEK